MLTLLHGAMALVSLTLASASPPDDQHLRNAEQFYRTGARHYEDARFDQALSYFAAAYQASALPDLLFDIAQCHMEMRQFDEAARFFESYIEKRPTAPYRSIAAERLLEAKAGLLLAQAEIPSPGSEPRASPEATPFYKQRWFWGLVAGTATLTAAAAASLYWRRDSDPRPPAGSLGTVDRR